MRYPLIAALFPLFALGNATAPAEQAPDPVSLQPGQWEIVTEFTSVEAPGAPQEFLSEMRASIARDRQTQSQCITAEQARNPMRNMLGAQNPAGCTFSETSWSGGNVRIHANCRPPEGPPLLMVIEGSYAARQFENRVSVTMEIADPNRADAPARIRLGGRMTGRRTGDCTSARPEPRPEGNSAAAPAD
jgi:hypothetical protein